MATKAQIAKSKRNDIYIAYYETISPSTMLSFGHSYKQAFENLKIVNDIVKRISEDKIDQIVEQIRKNKKKGDS